MLNTGYNTIVVLTDLSKTGLVELSAIVDDNQIEKSITIKGGGTAVPTLTRIAEGGLEPSDKNDRVLKVSGGAKIKFENIIINGITDDPGYYHGALAIGEAAVSEEENPPISQVTLGNGAVITGKKDGTTNGFPTEDAVGPGIFTGLYGELVMEQGSKVTGCETSGGGNLARAPVTVAGGKFTMNGGEISKNTIDNITQAAYGGGVFVGPYIINNQPSLLYFAGEFTMNDGEISENTIDNIGQGAYGGGVCVSGAYNASAGEEVVVKFTMNGGKISGNTVAAKIVISGGGVFVGPYGIFDMSESEISGNKASNDANNYAYSTAFGGGVFVDKYGKFKMKNSRITGNEAAAKHSALGGGVHIAMDPKTEFNMIDGEISGNKTTAQNYAYGGGVFLNADDFGDTDSASFTMEGGIIYGSPTDDDDKKGNIAASGAALTVVHKSGGGSPTFYHNNITKYPIIPE